MKNDNRLFSLDILRGLDMILLTVIGPVFGAVNKVFPMPGAIKYQFDHPWGGFTLWDIIMPLFIFMCGAAIPYALAKRLDEKGRPTRAFWSHLLSRVGLLWFCGMLVQGNLATLDILKISPYNNTLETIAAGYLIAALVMLIPSSSVRLAFPLLLAGVYGFLLHFLGDYSMTGNFATIVEAKVLTAILPAENEFVKDIAKDGALYGGYTWFLTTLMFGFMTLSGVHCAEILRGAWDKKKKAIMLFALGGGLLAFGWLLVLLGVPMIKQIFTVSFTFQAMGWCTLLLALLYVLTDVLMFRRGWYLVTLYGQCALTAYMASTFFRPVISSAAKIITQGFPQLTGDKMMPIVTAVVSAILLTLVCLARRQMRSVKVPVVKACLVLALLAFVGTPANAAPQKQSTSISDFTPVKKKYIVHGWDLLAVSPKEILANAKAFDDLAIDGVTLMIKKKLSNGRRISQETIMNDPLWPREELKSEISVFKEIVKHPSLKDSFISSWWAPGKRLKWTDDKAWERFAANMATVAWLAKEGGLKGILVDAEDYPKSEQYFRQEDDPEYDELAQIVRRRGAQVFKAIFDEFPDATILSFWMLTLHDGYFESANPMEMAKSHGDLWPHFVNGMLDAMPSSARFIDGNEHAYLYKAEEKKFHRSACLQRTAALGLVASENRQKYLAQLRVGFGLYLDSYIATTNSQWYLGPVDGSRVTHFSRNLAQATEAADEFVWIYGEKNTWIKWQNIKATRYRDKATWDEALPGLNDVLLSVKSPQNYLRKRMAQLREEGKLVNLADTVKRPWGKWQNKKKAQGTMGEEGTGVFLEGVGSGSYMVRVCNVKPRETYAVSMKMKGVGGSAVVYWMKNGKWQWQLPGFPVVFAPGANDTWRTGEVLAHVPEGATDLVLQLGAKQTPGERVTFDEVEIVKFED